MTEFTRNLSDIGVEDIASVGGKNASLGEMGTGLSTLGVNLLDGCATTAEAFRRLIRDGKPDEFVAEQLNGIDVEDIPCLESCGKKIRLAILARPLTDELDEAFVLDIQGNIYAEEGRQDQLKTLQRKTVSSGSRGGT